MIQDTSLQALTQASKNLGDKQHRVFLALQEIPTATNAELGAKLGWPINRITPRILELREMGLVEDAGKRTCGQTGSTAHAWKAKAPVLPPAFEPKPTPKVAPGQSLFA
jgi:hypothetical protein